MLHCRDGRQPGFKADMFYELLQDGGVEKQGYISASDKDWEPVCKQLFFMVTKYAAIGAEKPNLY